MGTIEAESTKRTRKTKLQNAILSSLELAGVLTLTMLAPNALQLLKKRYDPRSLNSVRNAATRLVKKGLIVFENRAGKRVMRITDKGRYELHGMNLGVEKPKRWDGKWRLVIFDIAEPRKHLRNLLRSTLDQIGFKRLQDSVWIYPYDCEDLIVLLKANFGLGKEVLYVIADSIERDQEIRDYFRLQH